MPKHVFEIFTYIWQYSCVKTAIPLHNCLPLVNQHNEGDSPRKPTSQIKITQCGDLFVLSCVIDQVHFVLTPWRNIKVNQSRYRPGVAQSVPGSLGSQISWQQHSMMVCQPYEPAAFTPRKCSWYSFLLEAECNWKDFMAMKNFMTTTQDGGNVVSLTHRPPLPPGNAPGTHFC